MTSVSAISSPADGTSPRWWPFALAALTLLSLILRLSHLHTHSLWLDDAYSLMIAGGHGQAHRALPLNTPTDPPPLITTTEPLPISSVISRQTADVHPPLYFLLLRAFYVFTPGGDPELARLPGIFFSVVTTTFLGLLTRQLLPKASPVVQLLPSLLFAIAPTPLFFSLEIRGYSLAALLTVLAALFTCHFTLHATRISLVAACASAFAALLTHYFTLFPLLGLLLWALLFSHRRKAVVLATVLTVATFFLAWGPALYHQLIAAQRWDDWISLHPEQSVSLFQLLSRAVAIPARLFADPVSQSATNILISTFLILLAILAASNHWHRARPVLLPLLALATTSLGLFSLDLYQSTLHVNFIRYALPAAPFAALLPACLSVSGARYLPYVGTGSLILYCLVFFNAPVQPRPDLRLLAHTLTTSLNSTLHRIPITTPVLIARPPGATLEDDPQTLALMLAPYLPPNRLVLLLDDTALMPSTRPSIILTAYGVLPLPGDARFIYYDPIIPAHIFLLP